MSNPLPGVIFDLDDTLVDTHTLASTRQKRDWKGCVRRLNETHLFPGVAEMYSSLRDVKVPVAIVTTSVSYYAERVLQHHGLSPAILIAYHDATPKPAPDSIHKALRAMKVSANRCVGLGDKLTDLQAYRAAGVWAIGAGWSPYLMQGPWNQVFHSPMQLLTALGLTPAT